MTQITLHPSANTSWWSRASGGRDVLRIAAPMVVSSLSWTIMSFCDRMMLNWVSGTAMAAAFSASAAWFAILCLPLGVCSYANTFVAQYYGSGQSRRIGAVVWQAIWIAVGFSPFVLAAIPFAPRLFAFAGHSPESFAYEVQFLQIISLGGPAMLIAQSSASFFSGRGQTWVVMLVDAAAALLNLALDYCWIFGYFGFPAWGVAGAASATATSLWVKAIVYVLLMLQRRYRAQYGTMNGLRLDRALLKRMLSFGGPSGLQMLLDVSGFTVFIFLIGRLGPVPAEATSMAFSISTLAFMPIYGLHLAVGILVGERLGENRDDLAARSTYTTLHVAWMYMLVISLLYALAPDLFLYGFFPHGTEGSAEQSEAKQLAVQLLRFVAAYNLLDATQMVFVGAIKGAGDTRFVLRVSLVLASLLALLSWLSVEVWHLGVRGCWLLITAWVWIAAAIFFVRFYQGKWRQMRVIEPVEPELGVVAVLSPGHQA